MEKFDYSQYCNYLNHSEFNNSVLFIYFCHNCKSRLCLECLKKHNINFKNHDLEEIKNDEQKLKIKLEEIENDKFELSNLNEGEKNKFGNTLINSLIRNLTELNNNYKLMNNDFHENYQKIQEHKIEVEKNLESKKINIDDEINDIKIKYTELSKKDKTIDDLFDSLEYLKNSFEHRRPKFKISSKINSFEMLSKK